MPTATTRRAISLTLPLCLLTMAGCRRLRFPEQPADYREYAYVTSGESNTVSVLDLVDVKRDRVLHVGSDPTGVTASPTRNEVYVVNTGTVSANGSLSVIDTVSNTVIATVPLHRLPHSISVDSKGERGYVANSGSNNVSVIDLVGHREIATIGTGEEPDEARISPDGRSLVVSNRGSGSISIYGVSAQSAPVLRATFDDCPGASDIAMIPLDASQPTSKVFVACTGGHTVLAAQLAQPQGSWEARQDGASMQDRLLARLLVGNAPLQLAVKPDGGEVFVSNSGSDSFSEISTWTNDVGGTYKIGTEPVRGLVSADNSTLWVSNAGADSLSVYSIDDGRIAGSVRTGSGPNAVAMSADEHLLLAANTRSGDVAVIRTHGTNTGPQLFTMLPAGPKPNGIAIKAFRLKK